MAGESMKEALVLRLDSRMAIMLNMLASAGCELVNENYETAAMIVRHLRKFGTVHPETKKELLAAISHLIEQVPESVLETEGMSRYSSNELRYKSKFP